MQNFYLVSVPTLRTPYKCGKEALSTEFQNLMMLGNYVN